MDLFHIYLQISCFQNFCISFLKLILIEVYYNFTNKVAHFLHTQKVRIFHKSHAKPSHFFVTQMPKKVILMYATGCSFSWLTWAPSNVKKCSFSWLTCKNDDFFQSVVFLLHTPCASSLQIDHHTQLSSNIKVTKFTRASWTPWCHIC